ncbi:MAG: hypothetical protein ABFS08_11290 [Pseudomonadota bacterium]
MSASHYPGGYDWFYTVVSDLASQKHNPAGSIWFAGALSLSMVLLWPYVSTLKQGMRSSLSASRYTIGALRLGLICGALVGIERLLVHDISAWLHKSHEAVALITFLCWYFGIIGLLIQVMLRHRIYAFPALIVVFPLLAIGITDFLLYLEQRDLGWVDASWREMGVPIWLSFAFWQWLAVGFLWVGLGLLLMAFSDEARG